MNGSKGYVIFCEDIRKESNGQHSYIGVFDRNIVNSTKDSIEFAKFAYVANLSLLSNDKLEMPYELKTIHSKEDGKNDILGITRIIVKKTIDKDFLPCTAYCMMTGLKMQKGENLSVYLCYDENSILLDKFGIKENITD